MKDRAVCIKEQRRFAWMVLALLFAGSVVNYIDRAVMGVVKPQLLKDLNLTNTDYGIALNAFLMLYMVFFIVGGRLADRKGYRRTFPAAVLFWSSAVVLNALARGLFSLSLFCALLGIGQGGFYPIAMRAISDWFPAEDRARAVGVLMCGISVGILVVSPLAAWATIGFGWRGAFVLTGLLGLVLLPLWYFVHARVRKAYGEPDPAPAFAAQSQTEGFSQASIKDALRTRKFWMVLGARSFADIVWFFYVFWIPGYFQEVRGFNLQMVARLLWIPFFCADVGSISGTWVSSALLRRGYGLDFSRKSVLVVSATFPIIGASAAYVPGQYMALGLVSLAVFGHLSWGSNLHTVITEICPARHVAALYGITGAAGTLAGAIAQPIIGRTVDNFGYAPVFLGTAVLLVIAVALLLAAGEIKRISKTVQPGVSTVSI